MNPGAISERASELLVRFNLTTAAAELARRLEQAGQQEALRLVLEVLEMEAEAREQRKIARLRRASQLPPGKTFDTLDLGALPPALGRKLRELAGGDFLEGGVNLLAFGPPGVGKSHAACALTLTLGLSVCALSVVAATAVAGEPTAAATPRLMATFSSVPPPGWSQPEWDAFVQECKVYGAEAERMLKLPSAERAKLQPLPRGWFQRCARMQGPVYYPYPQSHGPNSPQAKGLGPAPTPTPAKLGSWPAPAPAESPAPRPGPTAQPPFGGNSVPGAFPAMPGGRFRNAPSSSAASPSAYTPQDAALLNTTGPVSPFAGDFIDACNQGQPPNVAADVNQSQAIEFDNVNVLVYSKNPQTKKITLLATESQYAFWCNSNGANGKQLPECSGGKSSIVFSDADIAFDRHTGQWLVSAAVLSSSNTPLAVFFAASKGLDGTDKVGNWNRWSLDGSTMPGKICPTAPYTLLDQPLIGFSANWVALDMTCHQPSSVATGPDTALLLNLTDVRTGAATLRSTALNTASFSTFRNTPSRDRSASGYANLWFFGSLLPDKGLPPGAPLVYWYVVGANGAVDPHSSATRLPVPPAAAGNYFLPNGPQKGCTNINCQILGNDARITAVEIQERPFDQTHYISLAFAFGVAPGSYQDIFYIQSVENQAQILFDPIGPTTDKTLLDFPTIAMDQDLNFQYTATLFSPNDYPSVQWLQDRIYPDDSGHVGKAGQGGLGSGSLQTSSNIYTGCGIGPQRWGDFNSTVWDPDWASPSGKASSFWSVVEYTTGGKNESSVWWQLSDPLPFHVSSNGSGVNCPDGGSCSVTVSLPSGAQVNDVVFASISLGEGTATDVTLPDSSWMILPNTNLGGSPKHIIESVPCNSLPLLATGWVAAHVVTGGESGSYTFKHDSNFYNDCNTLSFKQPGLTANVELYRDAGHVFSQYQLSGFASSTNSNSFKFGPFGSSWSSSGTMIVPVFDIPDFGYTLAIAGSPPLTIEDGLTADAADPEAGMSFGSYTLSSNCVPVQNTLNQCGFLAWGLGMSTY